MSTAEKEKKNELVFESYNAMSRPAAWAGVPIMPLVGLMFGAMIFGVGLWVITGSILWGLVAAFPFFIAIIALRIMTNIDDRYVRRVIFGIRRIRLSMTYGRELLFTPSNPMWSNFYGRRYAEKRFTLRKVYQRDALSGSREHGDSSGEPTAECD